MPYYFNRTLRILAGLVCTSFIIPGTLFAASDTTIRFDFESGNLQNWQIVEGSFGKTISDRERFHNINRPYNKQGKFFLSTLEQPNDRPSDKFTGILESPVFILSDPKISFLVGGGKHNSTYVALCTLEGKVIKKAQGQNAEPMQRIEWNLPDSLNQKLLLRIVDQHTGGWGHVTFDDFTAQGRIDENATKLNFQKIQIRRQQQKQIEQLNRQALLKNSLVKNHPLLFVTRPQYRSDHHNTATLFQVGEVNENSFTGGGALKILDVNTGKIQTLLETPQGIIRDPEVHFSGKKIVFSMRKNKKDDYHIYEINGDGSGLKQLTFAQGVTDIDPLYLPDDSIIFSSTREPKFCMCNRHIMANLFRMQPDGANIHQIGKNTLFEGHASLLPDGRILYDRWEYVDRNFGDAQGLWTVNPDGTNHAVYYGNNTISPGGVIDARPVPGTQQTLCIFGSCHDRPWGALALIDRQRALDGIDAVIKIWPESAIQLMGGSAKNRQYFKTNPIPLNYGGQYGFDNFTAVNPKYEDPYPLNDKYFLCSRTIGKGEQMGIYLVDIFGNELLLHSEAPGCYDPIPLGPRSKPPMIPSRREFDQKPGYFYIMDVYQGTHMNNVPRGTIASLRVVESPEKRYFVPSAQWGGQGQQNPAMAWHDFNNKRILGTVPVEKDGSVYFEVPAETFVYFQLLDDNGMMVQSMRSGTLVQPGETTGCVGCHDHRLASPASKKDFTPIALKRPAQKLTGWYGPPREFSFIREVQPVLDKYCVKCHDFGTEPGKKLNLAGDRTMTFNVSYNEMWRKGYIKPIGAGPATIQQPYSWGAHASKLIQSLLKNQSEITLDEERFDRLVTWIDLNAPYYPTYASAYPHNLTGRSPLNPQQVKRLEKLTGISFGRLANHNRKEGPQVSFDRPELSPCLEKFTDKNDPQYIEALSIIQSGKQILAQRPRADMPDFVPWDVDQKREEKYQRLYQTELVNRAAIQAGEKVFDRDD
jgi:hydrazine synthase alpha subunit-like protein